MREIKFRMWDKENEIMSYFDLLDMAQNGADQRILLVNEVIIQQFTGLLDKNGKEVFEGDIIKWDDTGETGYVGYMSETTEYVVDDWKKGNKVSEGHSLSSLGEVEVIGNIFSNPELLN